MLGIGMVGIWHVHTKDYYQQLMACDGVAIRAVWDEDPAACKAWAAEHGVDAMDSYETLLQRDDIQAIVCDAPTTKHRPLLEQAAKAGKHIFTEKLLATNAEDAEAICKAIESAGILCTVSLPLLASGLIRYAKQLIESGTLGRVTGARMRRSHGGVSDGWLPERWFDVARSGGGALMDLGAHPVYVLAYLLGAPKRVSGLLTNLYGTSADENAIALVEFEGGALATCETAFVTFGVPDLLEVYGTEGSLFIHGDSVRVATKAMQAAGVTEAAPSKLPESLPLPLAQFVAACKAGGAAPAHLTPRDALVMTRIIEAAYASDKRGETVSL